MEILAGLFIALASLPVGWLVFKILYKGP